MRLTVVIPATNQPETLGQALEAIHAAAQPPEEIIVVDEPERLGPAAARNLGARDAGGDLLVFIDADVAVEPDTFERLRSHFETSPGLTAVFGAYDDDPSDRRVVSSFRNLLHHYVHRGSAGRASTFWTGIGAVRRDAFIGINGFDEGYERASIEDIEFGGRLSERGYEILLDPEIQGKHLKTWSLREMISTDILRRGAPWVALMLRRHSLPSTLNLGWRHRLSALALLGAIVFGIRAEGLEAALCVAAFLALNVRFYYLLLRRRGVLSALAGPFLHAVHHLSAILSVPIGVGLHLRRRRSRGKRAPVVPVSAETDESRGLVAVEGR